MGVTGRRKLSLRGVTFHVPLNAAKSRSQLARCAPVAVGGFASLQSHCLADERVFSRWHLLFFRRAAISQHGDDQNTLSDDPAIKAHSKARAVGGRLAKHRL